MTEALLRVTGLRASYGSVRVLHGLDLTVGDGEIVVLLGANGAGKTTTLRALSGMVSTAGSVELTGTQLVGRDTSWIVRQGVAHVPQGRGVFGELTVEENLRAGAFTRSDQAGIRADIAYWYDVFPQIAHRRGELAGRLSGGEQQMLSVARALMSRPRLLLLDEPSLGLAPVITQSLFTQLVELNRESGTTMLIVEQNANLALEVGHRAYVLESGYIALSGSASELVGDKAMRRAYLGY